MGLRYDVEQSSLLFAKQAIIRVIKSRSMRWANREARMSQRTNSHRVLLVTPMFGNISCRPENIGLYFLEAVIVYCRLCSSLVGFS